MWTLVTVDLFYKLQGSQKLATPFRSMEKQCLGKSFICQFVLEHSDGYVLTLYFF